MFNVKNISFILSVFVMSFLVGYSVLSWTEPAAAPPESNAAAPLNVGLTAQTKTGNLSIPILYDSDDNSYYINPASTGASANLAGNVTMPAESYVGPSNTTGVYFKGGNVGIGTTSPGSAKLDVSGQIMGGFGAASTGGTLDWNDSTNARPGSGFSLLLGTATNGPGGAVYYHPFSFEYGPGGTIGNLAQFAIPYNTSSLNNGIYLRTRYSGTWTSWTRLISENTSGKVGIGTTSPTEKLDVVGNIKVSGTVDGVDVSTIGGGNKLIISTRDSAAASGDVSYTGVGFKPRSIIAIGIMSGSGGSSYYESLGFSGSDKAAYSRHVINASTGGYVLSGAYLISLTSINQYNNSNVAIVKSYDADGFTLTWTKTGNSTGIYTLFFLCLG